MKARQSFRAPLRPIVLCSVLFAMLFLTSACSHMSYSRGVEDTISRGSPEKKPDTYYEAELDMNEIRLVDNLGVFCAALAETSEQIGNERKAYQEAVRDKKRSYEYSWRERSPSEFQGMSCGAYYKWGSSDAGRYYIPGNPPDGREYSSSYGEGGLSVSGVAKLVEDWDWLRFSAGARIGMGRYTQTFDKTPPEVHKLDWALRVPLDIGVLIYPEFLYGFGIEGFGGADLVGWALSSGNGDFSEKFDFGGRAGYIFTSTYFALSAYAGWERRNFTFGEFWTQYDALVFSAAIDLNYFEIF